jgi:hypothetical protein
MNKKEKAQLIISILDKFYKKTPVPLKHSSPLHSFSRGFTFGSMY